MIRSAAALLMHLLVTPVVSETVEVGRGSVDLDGFECRDITRSSILQRVCYDRGGRRLVVAIRGAYDQYCNLPAETFDALMGAPSMGQYFNRHIRNAAGAPHACRS